MNVQHSALNFANINGIKIAFDSYGSPDSDPILLIAGLGDQLINWPEEFCKQLASLGYWVIRFDNRDAGLTTRFDQYPKPKLAISVWNYIRGYSSKIPYTLEDMAQDAVGLLSHLGLKSAHIMGGSLGGMIAEICAIKHTQYVETLTIFMSMSGNPWLSPPNPKALILFKAPPNTREEYIEHVVKVRYALRGGGFEFDEPHIRKLAGIQYDRSPNLPGSSRQMAAILASIKKLQKEVPFIDVPTLVVHGNRDPLMPVKHAYHTAKVIPKSKLVIIDGLGHELPPTAWTKVIGAITSHAV